MCSRCAGGRSRRHPCWLRRWDATRRRVLMLGRPCAGAVRSSASVLVRVVEAPAGRRLGESDRDPTGGVAAGGRGRGRCRRQAAVHVAAHREHPSPARVRQAERSEPGGARRRGASRDRVMSSLPPPNGTILRMQQRLLRPRGERCDRGPRCDDAEDLRADQRGGHRGVRGPAGGRLRRAPGRRAKAFLHEGGTLAFFRSLAQSFPDMRMDVET